MVADKTYHQPTFTLVVVAGAGAVGFIFSREYDCETGIDHFIHNNNIDICQLECGTWYHHPRRLQCVKFSKSQRDIIDAVTISKIIVFEIICNVAYYSATKITFPIAQPSNKATKCGIGGFWKLKVKPNLSCCSNIAITISYISVFVSSW